VVVGVCRITFSIPGNDSLKGKRRVVRRIVDRTRNQFNAAVAEVGALDQHRRALIGFAVVSNDSRHANSMLDNIGSFVSGLTEAVVVGRDVELMHLGEMGGLGAGTAEPDSDWAATEWEEDEAPDAGEDREDEP
jgi:uncharacterized protein YlxP (DUF503 family)